MINKTDNVRYVKRNIEARSYNSLNFMFEWPCIFD